MEEYVFLAIIGIIMILFLPTMYLLSKKYPKISRELHKNNCHCKVCYPIGENQ